MRIATARAVPIQRLLDALGVVHPRSVIVGQDDDAAIPQRIVVILFPAEAASSGVGRRDQARLGEPVGVFFPLGDEDQLVGIGREELGQPIEDRACG